ncbi:sensor histidine kinase [Halotalea alkalilenta]|uniref:histidine kinase n=1 Tax=Halotalea alkalilenta TaxID=376489 RepID=A0A172YC58_9GAMM|nr:sensor histidine kinase [Halotalea alkalilenta]ANF56807.1 hypothetical protein A5892_04435 [Halotalea alkalilenta]
MSPGSVRTPSLRGRLLGWIGLALLALLGLAALKSWLDARANAEIAYDRSLLTAARVIGDSLQVEGEQLIANAPYSVLDPFSLDSGGSAYYQVIDPRGRQAAGFVDLPAPPEGLAFTRRYPALARFFNADYGNREVRVVSLLVPLSDARLNGMAEIRVAEHRDIHRQLMRQLLERSMLQLALFALVAFLLFAAAISTALRPLERVARMIQSRDANDLGPLPLDGVQREVRGLIEAINHLTVRLEEVLSAQRAFVADAAHQLRTPLFALRAQLELGLRNGAQSDLRAILTRVQHDLEQLTLLSNRLLSLARVENDLQRRAFAPCELTALTRDFCLGMASLAHQRGLRLAFEADGPCWIAADAALINELLAILIGNAQAYTPKGGQILVKVARDGVLEVEDDGPGIPEEERERVFERFYRGRHRERFDERNAISGTGLGLAIAQRICNAHGAEITLSEGQQGGTLARVMFVTVEPSPTPKRLQAA